VQQRWVAGSTVAIDGLAVLGCAADGCNRQVAFLGLEVDCGVHASIVSRKQHEIRTDQDERKRTVPVPSRSAHH
jgi:hypothetical protein